MRRAYIPFILVLAFAGCDLCSNDITSESVSPDGNRKIVIFSRDCGATTGFSTQATLLNKNESLPDDGGNIFILEQGEATAEWKNNTEILVRVDSSARFFKKESLLNGVTIFYQTK